MKWKDYTYFLYFYYFIFIVISYISITFLLEFLKNKEILQVSKVLLDFR